MMALICEVIFFRLVASLPHSIYYLIEVAPNIDPDIPYYIQDEYLHSTYRNVGEFLNQSSLRIAVLINMVRWTLVCISKLSI